MTSSRARTLELLVAYRCQPSLARRNQIVELNLGLVRKVAHQLSHQCSEPYDDLAQTGYLGLIRAVERFDPQQGCAFSSFALPYIRGAMLHYLRDRGSSVRLPRYWHELQARGRREQRRLAALLGRQPSEREVAAALEISLSEWRECQAATRNCQPLSLDVRLQREDAETVGTLAEALPDRRPLLQQQETQLLLDGALGQLEGKLRVAVDCVYRQDWSRQETAAAIGVSPMTVTRYLNQGLDRLSELLATSAA